MNIAAAKIDTEFLQNATVDELKEFANAHPYFSPAQFFLTKKMKQQNDPEFLKQLQKTAAYFSNPFWLHYQLLHDINFTEEANLVFPGNEILQPSVQQNNFSEEEKKEEIAKTNEEDEIALKNDIDKVLSQNLDKAEDQEKNEEDDENEEEDLSEKNELPSSKLSEVLQAQFDEFKKPVEENAAIPVEIKSYHTVDYFASQGIKLDAQLQDKLGKQVLRFTDWLKQMKRINAQPADLETESELENKVIDIAAHSNEPKEVITEAMAEVLEKQGKTKQAVELYEKLSLLHPDKSVYFAARIQQLKG